MSIRTNISILLFSMVQAVLFFAGVIVTLMVTDSSRGRLIGFVLTIVLSLPISWVASWWMAPRLRARYVRDHVPAIREEL